MKCLKSGCEGTLYVTHTYTSSTYKYQRAVCERCKTVHRLDTAAVIAQQGAGAKAMANRVKGSK